MSLKVILLGWQPEHIGIGIIRLRLSTCHRDSWLIVEVECFEETIETTLIRHTLSPMKQLLTQAFLKPERFLHFLLEASPEFISFLLQNFSGIEEAFIHLTC